MGFFFKDYSKPGPGVEKNQPKKSKFAAFCEIYFGKLWKLTQLNFLYFICCIPIVTFGPATAAFTKILRNYSQDRHAFLYSDFFEAFKKNFKQTFLIGIVDIFLIAAFVVSIPYYSRQLQNSMLFFPVFAVSLSVLLIIVMMHFYIYLMIVSTTLKTKEALKNSLILAISEMKKNVVTLVIVAIVVAVFYLLSPYTLIFIPFFPLSLIGLVICFNTYPIIRRVVIQPFYDKKGELNPEYAYLYPPDDEYDDIEDEYNDDEYDEDDESKEETEDADNSDNESDK